MPEEGRNPLVGGVVGISFESTQVFLRAVVEGVNESSPPYHRDDP
jgi:hypothetical protein